MYSKSNLIALQPRLEDIVGIKSSVDVKKVSPPTHLMHIVKKQEKPQGALTPPLFSLPLGSKIYYGQVEVGDLSYLLRACDDNMNQDTTCLITLF